MFPNPQGRSTTDIFKHTTSVTNLEWQIWHKPAGCTYISIFMLGGGGGGGGAFTHVGDSGGGGGGGSAAQATLALPAMAIPDTLYVQVGKGGAGGIAAGLGGAGMLSYVSASPSTVANDVYLISGSTNGIGGTNGTGAAGGVGGTGGGSSSNTAMILGNLYRLTANTTFIAGQTGTQGGDDLGAVGIAQTIPTTGLRCMGGTGGAGGAAVNFAGGLITGVTGSWLSDRRPGVSAVGPDGNGPAGNTIMAPFWSWPGMGGGGNVNPVSVGGSGGQGGYGSGGGGGGAGSPGGPGGPGGDGIVIITSW